MKAEIINKTLCVITETKAEEKELRKLVRKNKGKISIGNINQYWPYIFKEFKLIILVKPKLCKQQKQEN